MSYTLSLGDRATDFLLPATDGKQYSLKDFDEANVCVIFFTCNHCPYVTGSNEVVRKTADQFRDQGVWFIGINANTSSTNSDESLEHMVKVMEVNRFPWLYLKDKFQDTALAYGALKTPHYYVFDQSRKLIYTGRAVDSPKDANKNMVYDLANALVEHLAGKTVAVPQTDPIGCMVKWDTNKASKMPNEACDLN